MPDFTYGITHCYLEDEHIRSSEDEHIRSSEDVYQRQNKVKF